MTELMIVVALLSLMAAIAVPSYAAYVERARIRAAIADLREIELEVRKFLLYDRTGMPQSLATIGKADLVDPWGNPYQYLNIESGVSKGAVRKDRNLNPLNTDFDLYSMGPDGGSKPPLTAAPSRDDIVRANNGAFIGPAEDY